MIEIGQTFYFDAELDRIPLGTVIRDSAGSPYMLDSDTFGNAQWYEVGRDYATPMEFPVWVIDGPMT